MATILNKVQDERPMEQTQIIPTSSAKSHLRSVHPLLIPDT